MGRNLTKLNPYQKQKGPPILGKVVPNAQGKLDTDWAWGLPVPRLPRSRYFTATGRVRLGKPLKRPFRAYNREVRLLLAPQRRQVRGRVRLGKVVRTFQPPLAPRTPKIKILLVTRSRRYAGKGKVKPTSIYGHATGLPSLLQKTIRVKLTKRSVRYAGKGKVKPVGLFGGIIAAPVAGKASLRLSLAEQRRAVRGQVYVFPHLATVPGRPPVRRTLTKLVTRSRRYAGKGKIKHSSVFGSNVIPPIIPKLAAGQIILTYQRRPRRGRVVLIKVRRTFAAIVQPKRVRTRVILAPERRFIRGHVILGKPVRSFAKVAQPKRHPLRVLLADQRRQVRGKVVLGKPVITFNKVLFYPGRRALTILTFQRRPVRGQVLVGSYLAAVTIIPRVALRPVKVVSLVESTDTHRRRRRVTRSMVHLGAVVRTFSPPVTPNTHRIFIDEHTGDLFLRVTPTTQIITPL